MERSKIQLSEAEMRLVVDAEIILTKNRIVKKSILLLEEVQAQMLLTETNFFLPSGAVAASSKISRGDKYLGLPYAILDYPRIASGSDLCFVRTMFWWGHFFSSTLHLSGVYTGTAAPAIEKAYEQLSGDGYFVGTNSHPWHHHFETDNYIKISSLSFKAFAATLYKQPHIKIAAKWPLSEWDNAANILFDSWKLLTRLIT